MKKGFRYLILFLCVILSFSFVGCDNKKDENQNNNNEGNFKYKN